MPLPVDEIWTMVVAGNVSLRRSRCVNGVRERD
jgi:hypothetical protein